MQNTKRKPSSPRLMNIYVQTLMRLRPAFVLVLAFSAATNVLMLTGSIYMLQVYDRVLSSGSMATLLGLFTIVIVLYGFFMLYDFLRTRMLARIALRIDNAIGPDSFAKWVESGLPHDTQGTTSQPLRDLEILQKIIASPTAATLFDLPFVPIFLVVLFIIHPWLGILTVAGVGIAGLIAFCNRIITSKSIQRTNRLDFVEHEFVAKSRGNAESIIGMGMQRAIIQRWTRLHTESLINGQYGHDPADFFTSGSRAFRMLLQSAILTLGAVLVLSGEITAGMIIAASILSGRVLAPLDQVIGQWRSIGSALSAHRRLVTVFGNEAPKPEYMALPEPTGQVTVTHLSKLAPHRAGTESSQILNDISFHLKPGDGLGVIGSSASGKSTLARMMIGAMPPDEGEIRFDGATPDQWDPDVLGRFVGYLPQSVELIPGTVRENIARFHPTITDEEVIEAARLTDVHQMILALPDGYATQMGSSEDPPLLSGGQIQRIGLARAVCGMPKLIVVDEPNSNLDIAGDKALTDTIAKMRAKGSVVVVMAHRPSALAALDTLMILDRGQIKLIGPKDRILNQNATVSQNAKTTPKPAAEQQVTGVDARNTKSSSAKPPFVRATHNSSIINRVGPKHANPKYSSTKHARTGA